MSWRRLLAGVWLLLVVLVPRVAAAAVLLVVVSRPSSRGCGHFIQCTDAGVLTLLCLHILLGEESLARAIHVQHLDDHFVVYRHNTAKGGRPLLLPVGDME